MSSEVSLDPKVRDAVANAHLKIRDDLPSEERLRDYYSYFRERFGPVRLRNLDGEELLRTMHGRAEGDSSLAYCLEFKNDDELPAIFGSIRGGSSFKFGLYQRSGGGAWVKGGSRNPIEIPRSEAIELARQHRDKLVEGCRVLAEFSLASGAGVTLPLYSALQQEIEKAAPVIHDTAWVHKYFSLLFPDLLDDYHVTSYQRYHILRLLLPLPSGPEARYANSFAFVGVAQDFGMPINHLTTVLNEIHGDPRDRWRIPLGKDEPLADRPVLEGQDRLALGWKALPDLSEEIRTTASVRELKSLLQQRLPGARPRQLTEFCNFVKGVGRRDLLVVTEGDTVVAVGEVTGSYEYDPALDRGHLRPVRWLSRESRPLSSAELEVTDLCRPLRVWANALDAEKSVLGLSAEDTSTTPVYRPVTVVARPLEVLSGIPKQVQTLLKQKGQVILYGPPGTGKTFWAIKSAREIAARQNFGRSWDGLSPDEEKTVESRIKVCTFHPAYGYEDFIERFEPYEADGRVAFRKSKGIFRVLCDAATENAKSSYFLVIDEINRGDIPRIFGELLTLLEMDKRETLPVTLPLSKDRFIVPKNVFLIGTMNTADRSIALLDTALRRRFAFIELMPDGSLFSDGVVGGDRLPLQKWFVALNRRIVEATGHDGRNLQVGHSFFLSKGRPILDPEYFMDVFRHELMPLVQEYCYDDWNALARILGETFVDKEGRSFKPKAMSSLDSFFEAIRNAFKADDFAPASSADGAATEPSDDDDREET